MAQKTFTAAEAATNTGIPVRTIQRLCQRHQIGKRLGRLLMLSAGDVANLRRKNTETRRGGPLFTEGNQLWKKRLGENSENLSESS